MLQKGSNHSWNHIRLFSLLVCGALSWEGSQVLMPLTDLPSVHSPITNRMQGPPDPGSPRFGSIVGFWEGVRMPLFLSILFGVLFGAAQESSMCGGKPSCLPPHSALLERRYSSKKFFLKVGGLYT
jgi:hypothetical protein